MTVEAGVVQPIDLNRKPGRPLGQPEGWPRRRAEALSRASRHGAPLRLCAFGLTGPSTVLLCKSRLGMGASACASLRRLSQRRVHEPAMAQCSEMARCWSAEAFLQLQQSADSESTF